MCYFMPMPIIYASEGAKIRGSIISLLREVGQNSELRVCDVGGGVRSDFRDITTDVIDFFLLADKELKVHIGDLNTWSTWSKFPDKYFDFVICTHTLEDIRDPLFVVTQLSRVAKSGFISVPNRHTELDPIEEKYWNGFYHHRWIFHFSQGKFQAIAKFAPFVVQTSLFDKLLGLIYRLLTKLPGPYLKGSRFLKKSVRIKEGQNKNAAVDSELSILWLDELDLILFNSDYAGDNKVEGISLCRTFVNQIFDSTLNDLDGALKKLKGRICN